MGSAGNGLSTVAGYGLNTAATMSSWNSARKRNEYELQLAQDNENIANQAAKGADARGAQQETASRLKYGAVRGEQTTALAASGVSVGSGSSLDLLSNTQAMSDYDAAVIHNNAAREAWGYREQARQQRKKLGLLKQAQGDADTKLGLDLAGGMIGAVSGAAKSSGAGGGGE